MRKCRYKTGSTLQPDLEWSLATDRNRRGLRATHASPTGQRQKRRGLASGTSKLMSHRKRLSGIIVLDIARPRPLQSVRSQVRCQRLGTLFDNVDKHRLESRDPLGDVLLAALPHPGPSDLDVLAVGRHSVVTFVRSQPTRAQVAAWRPWSYLQI